MKILVTGDMGFIGTHLKKHLKTQQGKGYEIKGFDLKDSESFKKDDGFTYSEKQDIRQLYKVRQNIGKFKPDVVIHLAALAGVRDSVEGYADYYDTNVTGTHNVIKASIENNVRNVLVASSSSIYGNNEEQPINELARYAPLSPYGISKVGTELVCKHFGHLIPITIFRPFTVYGANGRPEMVIPKLIDCARNKKIFERYGNGETTRGYTNVHDLVEGIEKLIYYMPNGCDVMNLGGQEEIKLNDLINLVKEEIGEFEVKEVPQPHADPDHNIADIQKAGNVLRWKPTRNFKDEIKKLCGL